ncbi:hypothetical protein MMC25_001298 [Agyrium rufum]|nr:hypothetical protein [Agyrium rufum]
MFPKVPSHQAIHTLTPLHQITNAQPTSAAATAAAQAFLANRASNQNLSNAAAAAALRSQTTSPINVASIQTKRMQRRGSNSSQGSVPNQGRPTLSRQSSSGSMTERTFRDPSPSRNSPVKDDPPPVPALPQAYASPSPKSASKSSRPRAGSVDHPARLTSPLPKSAGRGVSLDRGPGVMVRPKKTRDAAMRSPTPSETDSMRGSVNFSRPMSAQYTPPASPTATQPATFAPQNGKPKKTAIAPLSSAETAEIQYRVQNSANSSVKKKKKSTVPSVTEGSHLAAGGMGGRPTGTAVDAPSRQSAAIATPPASVVESASPASEAKQPSNAAPRRKKKRSVRTIEAADAYQSSNASDSDNFSDRSASSDKPRQFNTRAAGLLTKQPSIVREDREGEEEEERTMAGGRRFRPTFFNKQAEQSSPAERLIQQSKVESVSANTEQPIEAVPPPQREPVAQPAVQTAAEIPPAQPRVQPGDAIGSKRESLSPSRTTRFSLIPTMASETAEKHEPLARSVSPAKSALKHSTSQRGQSPANGLPIGGGLAPSEASDRSSIISDDSPNHLHRKKKNVRVSFEDQPIIVGESTNAIQGTDSPVIMSPQNKRGGWFRDGKRQADKDEDEDSDGIMRPRPALPSFGSVRSRTEIDEPLVKPRAIHGIHPDTSGGSSDHAIGGILSRDFSEKPRPGTNTAASSQPSNDPLPPEVTSVEGHGGHSDTESSTNDDIHNAYGGASADKALFINEEAPAPTVLPVASTEQTGRVPIPFINVVQPPTPEPLSKRHSVEAWLGMPGVFPSSSDDLVSLGRVSEPIAEHHPTDPTPADIGIAEPTQSSEYASALPAAEGMRRQIAHLGDDTTNDTDSIYSDAAEDLSDVEGDGFGSINAIVESPAPAARTSVKKSVDPESDAHTEEPMIERPEAARAPSGDWDQAQSYWSGVNQSRKQTSSTIEGTNPAPPLPVTQVAKTASPAQSAPKPRKKKSITTQEAPEPRRVNPPAVVEQKGHNRASSAPQSAMKKSTRDPAPPMPVAAAPMRTSMRSPPPQANVEVPSMRASMRSPPPQNHTDGPTMRSSMRGGPSEQRYTDGQTMRSSMRDGPPPKSPLRDSQPRQTVNSAGSPEPRAALQKKLRPVSAVPMADYNKRVTPSVAPVGKRGAAGQKPLTPVKATPARQIPISKPALQRIPSDLSDSSYTKARPSTSGGMRRSMRSNSVDERPRSSYTSPQPVRSISPDEPGARSFPKTMRTSMRGSIDTPSTRSARTGPAPSLRQTPTATRPLRGGKYTSRFADSSDEGDDAGLANRFRNSSDEEDARQPKKLTPIRGIPKRTDEGDSTDLEDSSDEERAAGQPKPKLKVNTDNGTATKPSKTEGAALASGSLRHKKSTENLNSPTTTAAQSSARPPLTGDGKKKRSFFGSFGRKREAMPSLPETSLASPQSSKAASPIVQSKPNTNPTPTSNPAAIITSATASPKSPKLQRRNTPKRFASDSWPLPQSPVAEQAERPNTSDGLAGAPSKTKIARSGSGLRMLQDRKGADGSADGSAEVKGAETGGKPEKKKRFPLLRKALGIHN